MNEITVKIANMAIAIGYNDEMEVMRKEAEGIPESAFITHALYGMGGKPTREMEKKIEDVYQTEKGKRYGLRHPWITGIPTLGIWPAIERGRVTRGAISRIMLDHPEIKDQMDEFTRALELRKADSERREIERDRANAARNTVGAAMLPIMAHHLYKNRRDD